MSVLDELALVLDRREVDAMLTEFGGTPFPFPVHPRGLSFERLAAAVGREAAERMCARFGGERLDIPTGATAERARRHAEIAARIAAGEPVNMIARHYRCSARWVRQIVARTRLEVAQ